MFLTGSYNLEQLIKEPTRVTNQPNQPNHISNSGVIDLGMSDHGLIYAGKKMNAPKCR